MAGGAMGGASGSLFDLSEAHAVGYGGKNLSNTLKKSRRHHHGAVTFRAIKCR